MDSDYPDGRRPLPITSENVTEIIDRYDTFLLDCDGVLWHNDMRQKFDGIGDTINKLREMGKRVLFISNHPRHTRESFHERFDKLCEFQAKDDDMILISEAMAAYVDNKLKSRGKVCVFGFDHIGPCLEKMGFDVINAETNSIPLTGSFPDTILRLRETEVDSDIKAVILSLGAYFDYGLLFKLSNYLLNPECLFLVTSRDRSYVHHVDGRQVTVPSFSSFVAAVEGATRRQATIIGKPSPYFFDYARQVHPDIDLTRTVMVGDNLDADIALAGNCGISSILVSTGRDNEQTTLEAVRKDPNIALPTYTIHGLVDIGKLL